MIGLRNCPVFHVRLQNGSFAEYRLKTYHFLGALPSGGPVAFAYKDRLMRQ